jgi:carbamoylphosphate synthase large subunit
MSKVLLVDTNFSASPIYDYLTKKGHDVYVCGGKTDDFLAKSVTQYIQIDYSNIDEMRKLIDTRNIDYIVPGCNDLSYQVCAALNAHQQFPGLDSSETNETLNNKEKFREFASLVGLPVPRVIPITDLGDTWPLIVKPVDAYSGRGMTVVQESESGNLAAAIHGAESFSKTRSCIIEEFVCGQLYSHTAFLSNNQIVSDFIVEEHGTANPFVVDTSRLIFDFPQKMLRRIRDSVLKMATELKLVNGLVHTQFIANEGYYWLIEVTRRSPGDLYSRLIELSTGFPYAQAYAMSFLGGTVTANMNPMNPSFVMRHTVSQTTEKTFASLHFNQPLQIDQFVPLSLTGDTVKPSPFSRIGLLFVRAASSDEFDCIFEKTLQRELYSIQ